MYTVGVMLIVVAVSVSSFNMGYLIRVLTNFFYSVSTVSLLVVPKYWDLRRERRGLAPEGTTGSIQVSGLHMNGMSTSNLGSGSSGNRTSVNKYKRTPDPVSSLSVVTENTPVTESLDGT
jgi:hypothetical protein